TQHGGATSHAAVVARGLGLPCVAGCEAIRIDYNTRTFRANGQTIAEGDIISLDGTTGEVFKGEIALIETEYAEQHQLVELLSWADELRRLGVRANADYPRDATRAREFGAEGIGLCRTEHMFFEEERLPIVQKMILSETQEERQKWLDQLLPFQRGDFEGIFRAMDGLPVIIRLIDPPLHEFLPSHEDLLVEITRLECTGGDEKELAEKRALLSAVGAMREANPMLGLRGCRLGLIIPGIVEMQTRAILEAAANVTKEGVEAHVEIMIPLISHVNELSETRSRLEKVAKQVTEEQGAKVDYMFGTMIEIPRAALTADKVAEYADFFSFGTNDLTQTTFGISRDDAEGKFLLQYVEDKILPDNPFQVLDREGVGQLVRMGTELGRKGRPGLEVGICGEHGGDPSSVEFCHEVGMDYVSCSPFRVPVARLAAAQASVRETLKTFKDV
ncbi:MAG: pyruvate, phosphate dikinase, partial [Anaerolineae bacterium]|nr:pyruvate, phosphate dikinase [Anaerolineae bacterium]